MPVFLRAALSPLLLVAVLAVIVLAPQPDSAWATPGRFDSTSAITISTRAPGVPADITINQFVPLGDVNYDLYTTHYPPQSDVHDSISPGSPPTIGDVVGTIESNERLGLTNQSCSTSLLIDYVLINAVPDASNGLVYPDPAPPSGGGGKMYPFLRDDGDDQHPPINPQTADNNGLPAGVEAYPSFLETLFNDGVNPIYPDWRYFGGRIVAGRSMMFNLMVFDPGDLSVIFPPNPLWDVSSQQFGYTTVLVLNDPTEVAAPAAEQDNCSALDRTISLFGVTRPNSCLPASFCSTGIDAVTMPCNVAIVPTCASLTPTGRVRYETPGAPESGTCGSFCTRLFLGAQVSLRDLDGDVLENDFDTCPTVATPAYDARAVGGDLASDPDYDSIPGGGAAGGCDFTPVVNSGSGNHDTDVWTNGDIWQNTNDNCPLTANFDQVESERTETDWIARPEGGPKVDAMGDACDGPENDAAACPTNALAACGTAPACTNAIDDDLDTLVNDGCPTVGSFAELGCLNPIDDPDEDGVTPGPQNDDSIVNDGCPSSARVANGDYWVSLTKSPICFSNNQAVDDTDGDGWCEGSTPIDVGGYPYATPPDPNDTNNLLTPEAWVGPFYPMPIAASGASGSPTPARQPLQECNDGVDNDGDTLIDLLDSGAGACRPPSTLILRPADSDGDGYSDEAEIHIGTDVFGRCEVGPGAPGTPSEDWPADVNDAGGTSRDQINTADLALFVAGSRLGKSPGQVEFNRRFDVVPGPGPLSSWINTIDLAQITTFVPPMFGVKAFSYVATDCTPHPQQND